MRQERPFGHQEGPAVFGNGSKIKEEQDFFRKIASRADVGSLEV